MISERGWACLQVRTGRFPSGPRRGGRGSSCLRPGPWPPRCSPSGVGSGVCPRKQAASRTLRHTSGPAQVWMRAQGARALARGTPPVSPATSFLESQHEVLGGNCEASHLESPGQGRPRDVAAAVVGGRQVRCGHGAVGVLSGGSMGRVKRRHGAA